MKNDYLIYALRDPITDAIRYVGKSSVGISRAHQHFIKSHNPQLDAWIQTLREQGKIPFIDILEQCNPDNLSEKEAFWIDIYKSVDLFNVQCKRTLDRDDSRNLLVKYNSMKKLLKDRRKMLHLKQEDVAEIAGITVKTIHDIENETGNPTFDNVKKYMEILGLELVPQLRQTLNNN